MFSKLPGLSDQLVRQEGVGGSQIQRKENRQEYRITMTKWLESQLLLDLLLAWSEPGQEEDDSKPLSDYLKPKFDIPRESTDQVTKNTVQFLNLKKCYEKVQKRFEGVSSQRPMDCNILMLAKFDPTWTSRRIDVYVQRHPDSAKLCGDFNGRVKLLTNVEKEKDDTTYFSVDLDSVYRSDRNIPVYKLSTVDPLRRNQFILVIRLVSDGGNTDEQFLSPVFHIRSRRSTRTTAKAEQDDRG